jgi:site-specific recombinase XerD
MHGWCAPAKARSLGEILALLFACDSNPETALRNRSFFTLLYRTGLRCSKALALEPKDIDFVSMSIRVLHGKGNRARTVGIDPRALDVVQLWLDERSRRGFDNAQPLFCTRSGRPMPSSYVRSIIKRLGIQAGIPKCVQAHGLRHTHQNALRERRRHMILHMTRCAKRLSHQRFRGGEVVVSRGWPFGDRRVQIGGSGSY